MKRIFSLILFCTCVIFSGCASSNVQAPFKSQNVQEEPTPIFFGEASSTPSETSDHPLDKNEIQQGIQIYSNQFFSVKYPPGFTLKETPKKDFITLSNEKGRIEIGDFEPAAVPVPQNEAQEDEFPKDIKYQGEVASALFYKLDDTLTMQLLQKIQSSITLKK